MSRSLFSLFLLVGCTSTPPDDEPGTPTPDDPGVQTRTDLYGALRGCTESIEVTLGEGSFHEERRYDSFGWPIYFSTTTASATTVYEREDGLVVSSETDAGLVTTYDERENVLSYDGLVSGSCTYTYSGDGLEGEAACEDDDGYLLQLTYDRCGNPTWSSNDETWSYTYRSGCVLSESENIADGSLYERSWFDAEGRPQEREVYAGDDLLAYASSWDCD